MSKMSKCPNRIDYNCRLITAQFKNNIFFNSLRPSSKGREQSEKKSIPLELTPHGAVILVCPFAGIHEVTCNTNLALGSRTIARGV